MNPFNKLVAYGVALLLLVSVVVSGYLWISKLRTDLKESKETISSLQSDLKNLSRISEVTTTALTARLETKSRITASTKDIQRDIPKQIPSSTPALPAGFRVLHDAATGTLPVSEASSSAPATPVEAADAANTIVGNYGACRDQDDAYQRLQEWINGVTK